MNIPLCFFISIGVAALGIVIAIVNFATFTRVFKTGETKSIIGLHLLAMALYIPGAFATLAFGIAWIVTYLKH